MEKRITLPLTAELAKTLHAGDRVLLTGTIYTSRDAGHKRMCEALARGEKIGKACAQVAARDARHVAQVRPHVGVGVVARGLALCAAKLLGWRLCGQRPLQGLLVFLVARIHVVPRKIWTDANSLA